MSKPCTIVTVTVTYTVPVVLLSIVQQRVCPVTTPLQSGIEIDFHWNVADRSSRVRNTETEGGDRGGTEDTERREG